MSQLTIQDIINDLKHTDCYGKSYERLTNKSTGLKESRYIEIQSKL